MSDPLDYCAHCFEPDEIERITTTPLRELRNPEISRIGSNAVYTLGNDRDFRYFLPRLIEVLVEDTFEYDSQFVFGKMYYVASENWPYEERHAIERYFAAQFEAILRRPPASGIWDVEEMLCCASQVAVPLRPLLDSWCERRDDLAYRNLLWFLSRAKPLPPKYPEWLDGPWWHEGAGRAEILSWLREPKTIAVCESAESAFPGGDGLL